MASRANHKSLAQGPAPQANITSPRLLVRRRVTMLQGVQLRATIVIRLIVIRHFSNSVDCRSASLNNDRQELLQVDIGRGKRLNILA